MIDRPDLLALVAPLARALRRIEDECADAEELTMWQYAILSAAEQIAAPSQRAIAERLSYSVNRIVGDIDLLADRGLVIRERGADRRAYSLVVTPDGARVTATIRAAIHRREDELLAHLANAERATLRTLLAAATHHPAHSTD
ncbi:MarR family winged helix-turn-helix transcriptional regulator [Tsukamurella soli]|uniref:HTH marR-type domain-containing protein n=1 Tax=Tsukamurella soli TaxID=644556 RepID=A0ABP8JWE2_9ACTN